MKIEIEPGDILENKTKIVVRSGDYVDVMFLVNQLKPAEADKLGSVGMWPRHAWSHKRPQFIDANLIWQKLHPDLVVNQFWNKSFNIYTVRTKYIQHRYEKDWEKDARLYLSLIDVMGFEKTKDDLAYWNIYHGYKDGEEVSYIIDWDELIMLGSEEKAYHFYKEELCRYQHSRVYYKDINTSELEERFDKLWREKVG